MRRKYAETPIPKIVAKTAVVKPGETKGPTPIPKIRQSN
jgi:hypothetical protein